MKKMFIAVMALIGLTTASYAQTTQPKKTTAPAATVAKAAVVKTQPAKAVTLPAIAKPVTPAKAAAPVKADGTLDMRFKANKEAAKKRPKLKKDGTPDKRYKQNKKS